MKIEIPQAVQQILETLEKAGFEAYIVGGCVRDALLNRIPEDWDITTSALPLDVKKLFKNTVDTGIKHGTVMVLKGGDGYEVTTYRVDGEYKDNRHPKSVTFTRSLEEDLKRRDFTINAFAYNPHADGNGLVDLFGGIEDLKNKTIRCVGNPDERFSEDALRIMRAIRFSAQLGFAIEPVTKNAIKKHVKNLTKISMERIRVEFEKTITSDNPTYVNEYKKLDLAEYIVPKIWKKCFDESLNGLLNEMKGYDKSLLLAAFFSHLTPEEADSVFRYLKYDNKTRETVVKILKYKDKDFNLNRSNLKRDLNEMGIEIFDAVMLYKGSINKSDSRKMQKEIITGYRGGVCSETADIECLDKELNYIQMVHDMEKDILEKLEPWSIPQLAVNGKDLIVAGVPAGTQVGETLEKLLQVVIDNPELNTRDELLKLI